MSQPIDIEDAFAELVDASIARKLAWANKYGFDLLTELETARAEIAVLRAFVQSCADDRDDTVSPGRKEQAKALTGTAGRSGE